MLQRNLNYVGKSLERDVKTYYSECQLVVSTINITYIIASYRNQSGEDTSRDTGHIHQTKQPL